MQMSDILQPMTTTAWIVSLPLFAAGLSVALPKIGRQVGVVAALAISASVAYLGGEILRQGAVQIQVGG
jgi:hypothetical protein